MKNLKLPKNHLLVFVVRGKEKFKGFWTPQKNSFADYYGICSIWIADMHPECNCINEGVGLGAKCYLRDVFDLESLPGYLVEAYASRVDFREDILKEIDEFGGSIEANIVHENALLGIEENTWKKQPKLSWVVPSSEPSNLSILG